MLTELTERLIKKEVKSNEQNILIEGIMLGENLSDTKRYSHISNECSDDELLSFKNKLLSITFPDTMSVDDRKDLLLSKIKSTDVSTMNEENGNIIDMLKKYRLEYIDACKNNDNNKKRELITRIKQLEQIR